MSRTSLLNSPLLLGFDEIERILDRVGKSSGEGYPPYNIERLANGDGGELLRITLAVAGFTQDQLDVSVEDSQLTISGKQDDDDDDEITSICITGSRPGSFHAHSFLPTVSRFGTPI